MYFSEKNKPVVYFDNAATTPMLRSEANSASFDYGNPSSPHGLGIQGERAVDKARASLSGILNCRENEILFTSGGTESNNLALIGFAMANKRRDVCIYAEPWEHPSVLEPLRFIKEQGYAQVCISDFRERLNGSHEINLFSISHICHETGHINNIADFAKSIKQAHPKAIIHVDGVQGFCKERINLSGIDLYSFSGHKCHSPPGVGGLVAKVKLSPLMYGGGQENGLRPGTENVASIVTLATTTKTLYNGIDSNHVHVANVKSIIESIKNDIPNVHINERGGDVSPYILNMSFLGINGETLVHFLSEKGIYISMGAACRSRKRSKSALELMGFSSEYTRSAVRFSFSHLNTLEEAEAAKIIIIEAVSQLRRMLRA